MFIFVKVFYNEPMKPVQILAIAPYEGMADALLAISKIRRDVKLTIRTGDLRTGLETARTLLKNNHFDIILSRGGTAELLRNELNMLVEEDEFSVYDLLRCLKMAENFGGKFAITGFRGITSNARILCDLLQMDTKIVTFHKDEDVLPELQKLKDDAYSLVICDMIGYNVSHSIGLNAVFVPSGMESINEALTRAVNTIRATSNIINERALFKDLLMNEDDGVAVFDKDGKNVFSTIDPTEDGLPFPQKLADSLPEFLAMKNSSAVRRYGDMLFQITNRTLLSLDEEYTVLRLTQKPLLLEPEERVVSVYNTYEEASPDALIENSSANLVGKTHELLDKYAPTNYPVVITGEEGTGKERAAVLLYNYGPHRERPFYVVDCSMINEKKWRTLMESDNSPFNEVGVTVHIKRADCLDHNELSKFFEYIDGSNLMKRNRIIISVLTPSKEADELTKTLTNRYSCLLLSLVPLRERLEDMPGIATLYINQMNLILGKHIVGFEEDAMQLMRDYHWRGNLDQFRRVLKELTVVTETSYISAEQVREVLAQEDKLAGVASVSGGGILDLKKPLDEINRDIVGIVLAEEGGNKERTSKRLNISRSTLWRMLKNSRD